MNTSLTFKKLPGVLSFERCIIVTDALFFNECEGGGETPLNVARSGMRGTQNINGPATDGRNEVTNIQITDTAKTSPDANGIIVRMGICYRPLKDSLNSCALSKKDPAELLADFRGSLDSFLERAKGSEGLAEVSRRFARNIANGRWLWRNRKLAANVTVVVSVADKRFSFDALNIPLNRFDNYSNDERELGNLISQSLADEETPSIKVEALLSFGAGMNASVEVYPSQNYLGTGKPKGFARSLYCVGGKRRMPSNDLMDIQSARVLGQAALRDMKVANALRTIDTWYPGFESYGQAIAVEPAGANLGAQRAFREGSHSAFAYAKRLNTIDPSSPEGMFMIASLLRGGVYSEGGDK